VSIAAHEKKEWIATQRLGVHLWALRMMFAVRDTGTVFSTTKKMGNFLISKPPVRSGAGWFETGNVF
jgi:hypothetical protein